MRQILSFQVNLESCVFGDLDDGKQDVRSHFMLFWWGFFVKICCSEECCHAEFSPSTVPLRFYDNTDDSVRSLGGKVDSLMCQHDWQ